MGNENQTEQPKEETNTFAKMEQLKQESPEDVPVETISDEAEPISSDNEVTLDNLSDTPVGDKKKYNRPNLHGQKDKIIKFQVFPADTSVDPQRSLGGSSEYWKNDAVLTYESVNEDGMNNREHISGARSFKNKDGGVSDINFWYKTEKKSQMVLLWERVAAHLGKEPEKMSPREFAVFLNSKPNIVHEGIEYDNFGAKPGQPAKIMKNMPTFVKE